jgi:hypothetical protein
LIGHFYRLFPVLLQMASSPNSIPEEETPLEDQTPSGALIRDLCRTIAMHEPFTTDKLEEAYRLTGSFDGLFEAVREAKAYGTTLVDAIQAPAQHIQNIIRSSRGFKPSLDKATVSIGVDLHFDQPKKGKRSNDIKKVR